MLHLSYSNWVSYVTLSDFHILFLQIISSQSAPRREMAKGIRTAETRGHSPPKCWNRRAITLFCPSQVYQFCIAGLQKSSPEEPRMHQNARRPGLFSGPLWGSLQCSLRPLPGG